MARSEEHMNFPMAAGSHHQRGLESSHWSSPWQMMRRMQEDMDRIFTSFLSPATADDPSRSFFSKTFSPTMDVSETEKEICIEVDLPGYKHDELSVEARGGMLRICAETKQPQTASENEGRQYHRKERRYGYFEEMFAIPPQVD